MVKLGFQEIIQFGNDSKHLCQQICLWKSFVMAIKSQKKFRDSREHSASGQLEFYPIERLWTKGRLVTS